MGLTMLERINFLQRYIIVHSYIYYELDNNVISDKVYDAKSRELVGYKDLYPELWIRSEYYEQFGHDYNGATGFTLYHGLNQKQQTIIRSIANNILQNIKKENNNYGIKNRTRKN